MNVVILAVISRVKFFLDASSARCKWSIALHGNNSEDAQMHLVGGRLSSISTRIALKKKEIVLNSIYRVTHSLSF